MTALLVDFYCYNYGSLSPPGVSSSSIMNPYGSSAADICYTTGAGATTFCIYCYGGGFTGATGGGGYCYCTGCLN